MIKKLLFLGADAATSDAVIYARSRRIHTIVTDYNPPEKVKAKQLADEYWMIDISDMDTLEKKCREEQISGVFAGSSEFCLDKCKMLCERLGLPFYASETGWKAARDKSFYKKLCREFGLLTPVRYELDAAFRSEDLVRIRYPVIVKPADACAQQGLSLVRGEEELKKAYELALSFSASKDIVVEEYVEGDEVFLFCFMHDGILTLLGISESVAVNEINGRKNYGFGVHQSRYLGLIQEVLMPRFQTMIDKMGCRNGACVFQGIFRDDLYYNLEICYRLDGILSWRHLSRSCGVSQVELMVDLALGIKPDDTIWKKIVPVEKQQLSTAYIIWGKPGRVARIVGRDLLRDREDMEVLLENFPVGSEILPNNNMRSIVFDITIYGDTYEDIRRKVQEINEFLHYYDPQGKELLIYQEFPWSDAGD